MTLLWLCRLKYPSRRWWAPGPRDGHRELGARFRPPVPIAPCGNAQKSPKPLPPARSPPQATSRLSAAAGTEGVRLGPAAAYGRPCAGLPAPGSRCPSQCPKVPKPGARQPVTTRRGARTLAAWTCDLLVRPCIPTGTNPAIWPPAPCLLPRCACCTPRACCSRPMWPSQQQHPRGERRLQARTANLRRTASPQLRSILAPRAPPRVGDLIPEVL